ncbi:MAG: hypothetical protein JWM82_1747 [Myxococcales bacterium]|nr:hypothetical protein [Myxococcales bacterium]
MLSRRGNQRGRNAPAQLCAVLGALWATSGCGSGASLSDGGSTGADHPMSTGGGGQAGQTPGGGGHGGGTGVGGAGGTVPLGYCDTFADCEIRSGCCGGSCEAKTDPKASLGGNQPVCATACAAPLPGPPKCGCIAHRCSNASECLANGAGECPFCPYGYQPGADGCQTCTCKPGDAGVEAATAPVCHWPAGLDAADAGGGACRPSRFFLSCAAPNGVVEDCLSDDPTRCAGDAMPGVTFTCHSVCAPNEYGAVCGSVGPGPIGEPPAGCHGGLATPGGTIFYCCPCG